MAYINNLNKDRLKKRTCYSILVITLVISLIIIKYINLLDYKEFKMSGSGKSLLGLWLYRTGEDWTLREAAQAV